MKNIYRIFLIAIIFLGCNTAKQTSNPKPPISNHDNMVQQIAPATCLLTVTIIKNSFDTKTIKAKVIKIHGYGSGFTRSFNANQEIVLKLSDKHLKEIKNYKTISCVISQVTTMNNNSHLKLIEIKQ